MRTIGLTTALAASLLLHGCSHKLDDPKPSLGTLKPDLVCNAQLTTAVSVAGSGLTPIPTRTLVNGEVLAAPTVTLALASDLSGAVMSAQPVTLNDATDSANAHVRWESEQQMSFDVTPDLMLAAGVYDVTLTNPDKKTATLAHSLAVVPPPSITAVMPTNICDAQQIDTVTITGKDFLIVGKETPEVDVFDANGMALFTAAATGSGCSDAAAQLGEMIQLCTTLTFQVPTDALPVGKYTLKVTNPAPAACASTESISFVVEPPPVLTDVIPATICAGGGTLDLKGMSFSPNATASLHDPATSQTVNAASTTVSADGTDAVARFLVSGGLTAGDKLDVTIDDKDGCSSTLPAKVTVVPAPIIFYVDPPFVYGGIVTPVTVYITAGITSLKSVTLTPNGQPNATPIDVTAASSWDGKHVIIDVPASLAAGAYDLTITNQSECPTFYAKAITVVTQTSPIDIDPHFGNTATDNAVQITSAAKLFEGGARAYLAPHAAPTPTAIPLASVVFKSATELTAVVRANLALGTYDLIVVNPSGTIGFEANAYTSVGGAVPSIDPTSPGSVAQSCSGTACQLPLDGQSFNGSAVVDALCTTAGGTMMTFNALTIEANPAPTATALTLDLSGPAAMSAGTICSFRLHETVAGVAVTVTGGTLVVRNASGNLSAAVAAADDMKVARRGHGIAFTGPTAAEHYLYAFGGDDGSTTTPGTLYDSVEFSNVDPARGNTKSAWYQMPAAELASSTQARLPSARTFVGAASVGRFVYAVGGLTAAATATTDVLRAESLAPAEAPTVQNADLTPNATAGLAPGLYFYRVAAVLDGGDALNPGGETLASDEFAIQVPSFGSNQIQVTIDWTNSAALAGRTVAKWRVYRTAQAGAAPGSEAQFADVPAGSTSIVDSGVSITAPPSTTPIAYAAGKPLPSGALGNWRTLAVKLSTARAGAGVAHVVILQKGQAAGGATNDMLYVGYGGNGTLNSATYDAISVTGADSDTPSEALVVSGGLGLSAPRWLGGGYGVMDAASPLVWFGPGNGTGATDFNHCTIDVSNSVTYGQLTCNSPTTSLSLWGYGAATAVGQLFTFGGTSSNMVTGLTEKIGSAPDAQTTPFPYSPQGGGTLQYPGATAYPLAFDAATIGGAYFWVTGGVTNNGMGGFASSAKTFYILY